MTPMYPAHKGGIRNRILCGFSRLFRGIGCWSASIPSEALTAGQEKHESRRGAAAKRRQRKHRRENMFIWYVAIGWVAKPIGENEKRSFWCSDAFGLGSARVHLRRRCISEIVDRRRIVIVEPTMEGAKQPYHFAETLPLEEAQRHLRKCAEVSERLALQAIRESLEAVSAQNYRVVGCAMLLALVVRCPPPSKNPSLPRSRAYSRRRVLSQGRSGSM